MIRDKTIERHGQGLSRGSAVLGEEAQMASGEHKRRVGLVDDVPNDATPAMLTAGPIGSVGRAFRSPWANCARVSLTVDGDIVHVFPKPSE